MKKALFLLFIFISSYAAAQQPTGVKLNDSAYAKFTPPYRGQQSVYRGYTLPLYVSLKKFTPVPQLQQCQSCVGWACAYAGLTTMWAVANNITDKTLITQKAFDPMYLYNHIADSCNEGSDILTALKLMLNEGIARLSEKAAEKSSPKPNDLYKISYYNKIFELNSDSANIVDATRLSLEGDMPVVIIGLIDDNLGNLTAKNYTWVPKTTREKVPQYHAMCVVGCDDRTKTFEIMNSWGANWANHGYFNISYNNFQRMVRYAFQIDVPADSFSANNIRTIAGDVEIDKNTAAHRARFAEIKPYLEQVSGGTQRHAEYLIDSGIKAGDTYKFKLLNIKADRFTYLIDLSPEKKVSVLYSSDKLHPADKKAAVLVAQSNNMVVTPLNSDGTGTSKMGQHEYCILYAASRIDINDVIKQMNMPAKEEGLDRLTTILKDRLVPLNSINYETGTMHISSRVLTGDVIPVNFKFMVYQ